MARPPFTRSPHAAWPHTDAPADGGEGEKRERQGMRAESHANAHAARTKRRRRRRRRGTRTSATCAAATEQLPAFCLFARGTGTDGEICIFRWVRYIPPTGRRGRCHHARSASDSLSSAAIFTVARRGRYQRSGLVHAKMRANGPWNPSPRASMLMLRTRSFKARNEHESRPRQSRFAVDVRSCPQIIGPCRNERRSSSRPLAAQAPAMFHQGLAGGHRWLARCLAGPVMACHGSATKAPRRSILRPRRLSRLAGERNSNSAVESCMGAASSSRYSPRLSSNANDEPQRRRRNRLHHQG